MRKIKEYFSKIYKWYGSNMQGIIFLIGLHFTVAVLTSFPYINILTNLSPFLWYLVDWIAILILFKPRKEFILKAALASLTISFFFVVMKLEIIAETLGEITYLMIATYIMFSIRESIRDQT